MKKIRTKSSYFFQDGEQNNASFDLKYLVLDLLKRMIIQKEIDSIDFFVTVF